MPTSWFVQNRPAAAQEIDNSYLNLTPAKPWLFTPHFGGGSNCWWGCTPRMLPEDFSLQTTYGVGTDWPFSYSDLESYYCIAEEWMGISGYNGAQPAWRSRPYPLGPHRLNAPDEVLHKAYPDTFIPQPTARASQNIKGGRGKCCANGTCSTCPVDAKFTIHNSFGTPYEDPRVQLLLQSPVRTIRRIRSISAAPEPVYRLWVVETHYGVDVLLRAFDILCDRSDIPTELHIVGDGTAHEDLLQQRASSRRPDRIFFHPAIPNQNVPEFLKTLSIFAVPSREESFGVAAVEASSVGLPVVVTNVGGLPEVVDHERTGLVVPSEDPVAMAGALERLVHTPSERSKFGTAGREKVEREYDWEQSLARMIEIYRSLIGQWQCSPR